MELSERNIQTLEKEGYKDVYEWFDESGKFYEEHSHEYRSAMIISEGSMEVDVEGVITKLGSGDRLDIPANAKHSVTVGSEGCKYVIGEG